MEVDKTATISKHAEINSGDIGQSGAIDGMERPASRDGSDEYLAVWAASVGDGPFPGPPGAPARPSRDRTELTREARTMKFSRIIFSAAVPLTMAGVVAATLPTSASASVAPKPVKTVHLVEKSGLRPGLETKAAQVSQFRILVKVGQFNRWAGSEDFKVLTAWDGTYKLEWAPNGHSTGRFLAVYEREQMGRDVHTAFFVPDARLVPIWFATAFRTGPAGPLGYSQLSTVHHHGFMGRQIEVLYLTAEPSGKLDLQTSKFVPFVGISASQLWRLDTQFQMPFHR